MDEQQIDKEQKYGKPLINRRLASTRIGCDRIYMQAHKKSFIKRSSCGITEIIKLNKTTLDIFKKTIIRKNYDTRDKYEALLGNEDIYNCNDTYIVFDYLPVDDGSEDGRFENIFYKQYKNGKEIYARNYTDEDISLMLCEYPDHPMLLLMIKTLNHFNIPFDLSQFSSSQNQIESQPIQPNA